MDEFIQEYASHLRALVRPDKTSINALTMLAEAEAQRYGPGIVSTLQSHILTCPAPSKLPAMYLMDSIIKNVPTPYRDLFAVRLAEIYGAVWASAVASVRASLEKLHRTWTGVFPQPILDAVAARMTSTSGANGGTQQLIGALVQPHGLPAPAHAAFGAAAPVAQTIVLAPQHAAAGGPQHAPYAGGGAAAAPYGQQQAYPAAYPGAPHVVQPLQPPAGFAGYQQQAPQGYHQQQQQPYGAALPHQQQQAYGAGLPGGGYAPVSPPYDGSWQQQQQYPPPQPAARSASPHPAAGYGGAGLHAGQSPHHPAAGGGAPTAAPAPAGVQITNMLKALAASNMLVKPGRGPSLTEDPALRTTDFDASFLKDFHPGVLMRLRHDTDQHRNAFLDLAFLRKQRQKDGSSTSRQWYVGVAAWIAGTLAANEAAPAFFDDEEAEAEAAEPEPDEPEDPAQPDCALSGEPFDKFYDPALDGWFYRGARRVVGDEAARYGLPEGAIVKVSCLAEAGASGGLDDGPGGGADGGAADEAPGVGAGGGGVASAGEAAALAADLAAAAAGADAGGAPAPAPQGAEQVELEPAAAPLKAEAAQGAGDGGSDVKSAAEVLAAAVGAKRGAEGAGDGQLAEQGGGEPAAKRAREEG